MPVGWVIVYLSLLAWGAAALIAFGIILVFG